MILFQKLKKWKNKFRF